MTDPTPDTQRPTGPGDALDRALAIQIIHRRKMAKGDKNLEVTEQELADLERELAPPEPLEAATAASGLFAQLKATMPTDWFVSPVRRATHVLSNLEEAHESLERRCATLQLERDEAREQREGIRKIYEEAEAAYRDKRDMVHHLQREMTKRRTEYELVRDERDTLQREIEALRATSDWRQSIIESRTAERNALKADLAAALAGREKARAALEATQAANEAIDAAHDPECWPSPIGTAQMDAISVANIQSSEADTLRIAALAGLSGDQ